MAITTQDGLVAAVAAGRTVQFLKVSTTAVQGFYYTLFRTAGMPGANTGTPATTGATFDRNSVGALPIPAPSGVTYCDTFEAVTSASQTLLIADRLVEFGGLSGNVTTAQTVSAVALPTRSTADTDVELWLECYTATGGTASATVTASYTNQAGVTGRTATLVGGIPASMPAGRMYQFALQAGDTGVQSVQSLTLGTATGTAGNIGLTLRRTILTGANPVGGLGFVQGPDLTSLQQVRDAACLELYVLQANGTGSTGNIQGAISLAQG